MSDARTSKTVLGPDCRISGELALDNDALIMGQFTGTLRVSGTLELSESSQVSGMIIAGALRLAGQAEADVVVEDAVELLPGAQLSGQLYTSRLNIVEGATFQGDVCVGPKAIQAAKEALKHSDDAQAQSFSQAPSKPAPSSSISHDQDDDHDEHSSITTMPGSVNQILQRRRPKMISARNGNGIG
ncbi:MAG: polymer-forming cytoskeletal protein [Phycisphaerales bacterium]